MVVTLSTSLRSIPFSGWWVRGLAAVVQCMRVFGDYVAVRLEVVDGGQAMKSRCCVFTWCESEARSGRGNDCVVAVDGLDDGVTA